MRADDRHSFAVSTPHEAVTVAVRMERAIKRTDGPVWWKADVTAVVKYGDDYLSKQWPTDCVEPPAYAEMPLRDVPEGVLWSLMNLAQTIATCRDALRVSAGEVLEIVSVSQVVTASQDKWLSEAAVEWWTAISKIMNGLCYWNPIPGQMFVSRDELEDGMIIGALDTTGGVWEIMTVDGEPEPEMRYPFSRCDRYLLIGRKDAE